MNFVTELLTDLFIIMLCVTSAPADQQEIRIDVVGNQGYMDTLLIRREKVGFTVHDEMNGKWVKFVTILPKDGVDNVFISTDHKGRSETIDILQGIPSLKLSDLKTKNRLRLKTKNGEKIAVDRSKEITFITPEKLKRTYIVH